MSSRQKRGNPSGEIVQVVATVPGQRYPLGFQQITLAAASSLTPPVGAYSCIVHAEVQNVRWRDDGTDPSATVGMRLLSGSELRYEGTLTALRLIAETAGAIVNVSYYG